MQFEPVKKLNSYEMIVDQIESGIREGRLSPGDRLPGERRLMETFSMSRPTVREAMRVLHATGVVNTRAGDPRGPEVLVFTPESLERPLMRMTHQEGTTRAELIQFRLRRSAGDATTLAEHIAAGDAAGARRTATGNIYRFYKDRLTDQEMEALTPLVG